MRPMRLAKREVRETEELRWILEDCDVVRIGLTDEEGMFIVPVNFGYELSEQDGKRKLTLYIHSAREGRKAEAFAKMPDVALEMDCGHELITGDYTCSYSYAYRSLMGTGTICEVTDPEEKVHGLNLLMQHMEPEASICYLPEMLARVGVYRIDVREFTGKQRAMKKEKNVKFQDGTAS